MVRLAAPGQQRLAQSVPGILQVTFAGAEANVAVALAQFGRPVRFVTSLPQGPLTDACLSTLRGQGVNVDHCRRTQTGRFGTFLVEPGANQRPVRIYYDRERSAVSLSGPDDYDWSRILAQATWLHVSGITPALSAVASDTTATALREATDRNLMTSFDVNYRSALWRWDAARSPEVLAAETLQNLLPMVRVLFAGPGDAQLLGFGPWQPSGRGEESHPEDLLSLARTVCGRFPELQYVVSSVRSQMSATRNGFGAALYDAQTDRLLLSPIASGQFTPWQIDSIVDRVGTGDAFAAGLIDGLFAPENKPLQDVLDFATAAGCLAHSVTGDFLYCTREEVATLAAGESGGRVQR